jgi:glycosyltransferase involved in cell wall biosynthesis
VTPGVPPPVSVCISAYNEAPAIEGVLRSVALQDYAGEIEVLVCANGCTDGTEAVVAEFAKTHPVRLIATEARGKPVAWNLLVEAARHDLLVFADADVRLDAGAVRALADRLVADRAIIAVGGLTVPDLRGCDLLTRVVSPPPLGHGCLVGRLYAMRRPEMREALAARGIGGMPLGVIHDDVWITLAVGRGRWATEPRALVHFRPCHWSERLAIERRAVRGERQMAREYAPQLENPRDEMLFLNETHAQRWARRRERWRRARGVAGHAGVIVNFLVARAVRLIASWQVRLESPRPLSQAYEQSAFSRSAPIPPDPPAPDAER